jgi:hypothetical protein
MQNELPDDTLLETVLLTGRAENIASSANIKTVGDLRKMSDAELLRLANCGKMAVLEFRLLTGQVKPGQPKPPSYQLLKIKWLKAIAAGQCKCSFEDWRKERHNAAGQ